MTDISKESVERLASWFKRREKGYGYDRIHSDVAATLRALSARIEELEDHILELQERIE